MDEEEIKDYASDKAQEIEDAFPPERCSLKVYMRVLEALRSEIDQRIGQVREEIG